MIHKIGKFKPSESNENSKNTTNVIFKNYITSCSHFINTASVHSVQSVELLQKTRHYESDDWFFVNDRDTQFFSAYLVLVLTLHMFRAHRADHQERQIVPIQPLVAVSGSVMCRPTCTRHGHRHRVTATRGCIDTICLSWWWAQCAQNIERVKNKYTEQNCASRWSFTKNHCTMNGQQNIRKWWLSMNGQKFVFLAGNWPVWC